MEIEIIGFLEQLGFGKLWVDALRELMGQRAVEWCQKNENLGSIDKILAAKQEKRFVEMLGLSAKEAAEMLKLIRRKKKSSLCTVS